MNVYSNKQRWKRFLLAAAAVIVLATLWYSNDIAQRIRAEEKTKVRLWSEAIVQRAQLVGYTQQLFEELGTEERGKADRLADAYRLINDPPRGMDLTFITDYLWSNKTIPVLIYDANDELLYQVNIPEDASLDSLKEVMSAANEPIVFNNVGHTVYWDESVRFSELKDVMQDLINSFISETVINSASVPVVMTDSTRTEVIRYQRVDSAAVAEPERLQSLLAGMAGSNEPIEVDLPGEGRHYIYYADSVILTQLRYYPLAQLVLIAVFTFVAYLIFSSFRRAEQDQVWVGMAKETAHQLGTPLSSLMAWVGLLEDQGVRKDYLEEMNRDIVRLNTVVDRFSKIGSKPALKEQNVAAVIESTVEYMKPRVSKKVNLTFEAPNRDLQAALSPPLFSWVSGKPHPQCSGRHGRRWKNPSRTSGRRGGWSAGDRIGYGAGNSESQAKANFRTRLHHQTARVGAWASRFASASLRSTTGGGLRWGMVMGIGVRDSSLSSRRE